MSVEKTALIKFGRTLVTFGGFGDAPGNPVFEGWSSFYAYLNTQGSSTMASIGSHSSDFEHLMFYGKAFIAFVRIKLIS